MSKKFISVLLSLIMLMSLFPLSIVFATNNTEILVGINTPFAPFEKKVNGEYVGYDIEVMNYICSQLNLKPKYIDMDFDKLMPSLISGEIDCIISAITATETRMQYADFTRPYFVGRFVYPEETIDVFERLSIALPKGSGYRQQFNDIIFEAEKNGIFKNIATKYNLVYDDTMASTKDTSNSTKYIIWRDDRHVTKPDKSGKYLLEYYYDKIVLNPSTPNLENINRLIQEDCDNFFGDDDGSWVIDNPPMYENEVYVNGCQAIVTKNDGNIFSIKLRTDWYAGGVHNAGYYGLNYNLKTGTVLTLSDLFTMPDDELLRYIKDCSKRYIDQHPDMYWWNDNFQNAKQIVDEYSLSDFEFYLEGDNVCICYPVYELGPGAMGPVIIECPIKNEETSPILKGDFSEFAGTYKYNSGHSFELLANGLSDIDVSDEETEYRVEDITKSSDGTYSWSINCYYYGECMDGIMCILYPKGVEVVSYDGSILPTDTSKVRFWSGNAEVSDIQYIAYKQDSATNEIKVVLNGEEIKFDQPPIMAEDRILVPIRKIAEAMGDTVLWNDEYQTAFIKHEDRGLIIKLLEDHIKIVKNEHWTQWEEKELDVMAFSLNGRTLVPVRAFCESLGADVSWNGDEYTAYITYDFNKETKEMSSETFKNINTVYYALNNDDVSFDAYSDDFNFFYNNRNMQKDAVKMGVSDIWAGVNDLLSGLSNSENIMKNSFEQMLTVVPNNDIVSIDKELFDDLKDFADNSKYIFDKINGIDDEFLELHPNLKTLDTSIEAVGTAYDIMSFSTEQIAVFLSNYETNISYIEQLRSILQENNLLDDNLNTSLIVLQQEYSDKFFNVMLNTRDELEKFTITEGTNFATGGLFSVGVFTWEQLFKLSGITDDGQALKTFYGLYCINGLLDTAYNRTNDKILNGDYTPSDVEDLKILDDLQRALKIKTYQCIKIISQDSDTHSMCDEYIKQISKSSILWKRD